VSHRCQRKSKQNAAARACAPRVAVVALLVAAAFAVPQPRQAARAAQTYGPAPTSYYDWQQLCTAHFQIIYPAEYRELALLAARIAEGLWPRIVSLCGVAPRERTPLILDDHGLSTFAAFAVPQSHCVVVASFHRSNRVDAATQLRYLIAHEMGHIGSFWAARGPLGDFGELVNRFDIPFWFSEGFAEYVASAPAFLFPDRLDLLRSAVLLGHLPSVAIMHDPYLGDRPDSLLGYSVGASLVDYIARRYGPDAPAEILRRTSTRGPFFEPALRKALGLGERHLFRRWRAELAERLARLRALSTDTRAFAQPLPLPYDYVVSAHPSPNGARLAICAYADYVSRDELLLEVVDLRTGARQLVSRFAHPAFGWSPDGSALVYAREVCSGRGRVATRLFLWDAASGCSRELPFSFQATAPCFMPDGERIVFVLKPNRWASALALASLDGGEPRVVFSPRSLNEACYCPRPSPDGAFLAFEHIVDGNSRIALLNLATGQLAEPIPLDAAQRCPAWSPEGKRLAFLANPGGVPDLFLYDRATGAVRQLTEEALGALRWVAWDPRTSDLLAVLAFDRRSDLLRLSPEPRIAPHDQAQRRALLEGALPRPAGKDPLARYAPLDEVAILSEGPYRGLAELQLLGPNLAYVYPFALGLQLSAEDPLREHSLSVAAARDVFSGATSVFAQYLNTSRRVPLRLRYACGAYVSAAPCSSSSPVTFTSLLSADVRLGHFRHGNFFAYDELRLTLGRGLGAARIPSPRAAARVVPARCAFARVELSRARAFSNAGQLRLTLFAERAFARLSTVDFCAGGLCASYQRAFSENRRKLGLALHCSAASVRGGGLTGRQMRVELAVDLRQRLARDFAHSSFPYFSGDELNVHLWYRPSAARIAGTRWRATHIAGVAVEAWFRALGSFKYRAAAGYEWGFGAEGDNARGLFFELSPAFLF